MKLRSLRPLESRTWKRSTWPLLHKQAVPTSNEWRKTAPHFFYFQEPALLMATGSLRRPKVARAMKVRIMQWKQHCSSVNVHPKNWISNPNSNSFGIITSFFSVSFCFSCSLRYTIKDLSWSYCCYRTFTTKKLSFSWSWLSSIHPFIIFGCSSHSI